MRSEREKAGLRSQVHKCRESWTVRIHDGSELRFQTESEYDVQGRILRVHSKSSGGLDLLHEYCYQDGRLILETFNDSVRQRETSYSYDSSGRLISIKSSAHDVEFRYESSGRKTKIEKFPVLKAGAARSMSWEGSASIITLPSAAVIRTFYNEADLPIAAEVQDRDGHVLQQIIRTYDDRGRVTMDESRQPDSMLEQGHFISGAKDHIGMETASTLEHSIIGRILYNYDQMDRLVETHRSIGLIERIRTLIYNEYGEVLEERIHTRSRRFPREWEQIGRNKESDTEQASSIKPLRSLADWRIENLSFSYEYDQHVNWTRRCLRVAVNERSTSDWAELQIPRVDVLLGRALTR
jgi:YD repeat-containing protein